MCGIAGILTFGESRETPGAALHSMLEAQRHRGPDGEGTFLDGPLALGHRRLSIIDLSTVASQPMASPDGRFVVSFNGEIYNYRELRAQLRDYAYRSQSDTEVILAAFEAWGEGCVDRLKGQFAFALWDRTTRRLFVARDRLGEKPFYYFQGTQAFVFASELRALLASGLVPRRVSRPALAEYLVHESVRAPRTLLQDVQQIPPGHAGWVEGGRLSLRRYWHIIPECHAPSPRDYREACARVRGLLDRAVEGQMISDVPLGVFLSGGIDSSALTGLLAERSGKCVETLSVVFDDPAFDERPYSDLVAKRFATHHHQVYLKPTALRDALPAFFEGVDAPSGDGPNTFVVARAAREAGLTVALSGVGGDELFCGYRQFRWYRRYLAHAALWKLPRASKRLAARAMQKLGGPRKLEALLLLPPHDRAGFYALVRGAYAEPEAHGLSGTLPDGMGEPLAPEGLEILEPLGQFSAMELTNYTRNVLLKDTDSLSMASSLEVRVPFCDHELVEYVLSLPDAFKISRTPKRLLIDALGDLLPESVVRRRKMGFSFPWARWMRGELSPFCEEALRSLANRGLLDGAGIHERWRAFRSQDQTTHWGHIWLLVSLEQWLRKTGAEP